MPVNVCVGDLASHPRSSRVPGKDRLKMEDQGEADQVFSSVGLLPHHDDQPFMRHMHHDAHKERHRNTRDYVAETHSPNTNRSVLNRLLFNIS